MKLMSIFLVFKESMGERELEKVFSSYDKAREYISGREWNGVMSIKEIEVESQAIKKGDCTGNTISNIMSMMSLSTSKIIISCSTNNINQIGAYENERYKNYKHKRYNT